MAQTAVLHDDAITDVIFNERTWGWDTAFPATWPANGWFWRTDENILYQNTGTEGVPVFTARSGTTDHNHSGAAGSGGKLDGDLTIAVVSGKDLKLIELAVI